MLHPLLQRGEDDRLRKLTPAKVGTRTEALTKRFEGLLGDGFLGAASLPTLNESDPFRMPSGLVVRLAEVQRVPVQLLNVEPLAAVATCWVREGREEITDDLRERLNDALPERSPLAPKLMDSASETHWEPQLGSKGYAGLFAGSSVGSSERPHERWLSVCCSLDDACREYYDHWKAQADDQGLLPVTAGELLVHPLTKRLHELTERNALRALHSVSHALGARVPLEYDERSAYVNDPVFSPPLAAAAEHVQLVNGCRSEPSGVVAFDSGAAAPARGLPLVAIRLDDRAGVLLANASARPARLPDDARKPVSTATAASDAKRFVWEGLCKDSARLAQEEVRPLDVSAALQTLGAKPEAILLTPLLVKLGSRC